MNNPGEGTRRPRVGVSGFSLVETVLAIAVIAVTFIGILGLLGLGVANDQTSSEQTVATNIAASIIADLRSTPYNATSSTRFSLTLPTSTTALSSVTAKLLYFDNAQNYLSTTYTTPAIYKASVYLTQVVTLGPIIGTASVGQTTYLARVVITWPAQTSVNPVGNVDILTQFRIN